MIVAIACRCRCHSAIRGDWESARQLGLWHEALTLSHDPMLNAPGWADITNPVEAAVAQGCPCLRNHVLIFAPPSYKPPEDWTPERDQADGSSEDG